MIKHIILANTIQLWGQLRSHPLWEVIPNSPTLYENKQTNENPKTIKFPAGFRRTSLVENNIKQYKPMGLWEE